MKRARIVVRDLASTFRDRGRQVAAVQDVVFEGLRAEARQTCRWDEPFDALDTHTNITLLRWWPEYRRRA